MLLFLNFSDEVFEFYAPALWFLFLQRFSGKHVACVTISRTDHISVTDVSTAKITDIPWMHLAPSGVKFSSKKKVIC